MIEEIVTNNTAEYTAVREHQPFLKHLYGGLDPRDEMGRIKRCCEYLNISIPDDVHTCSSAYSSILQTECLIEAGYYN